MEITGSIKKNTNDSSTPHLLEDDTLLKNKKLDYQSSTQLETLANNQTFD